MSLLQSYLKDKRPTICYFLGCCMICVISFGLFHLPVAAVLYPAGLCAAAGALLLGHGYLRLRQKHSLLSGIRDAEDDLQELLPAPDTQSDRDYQALIAMLCRENRQIREEGARQYSDAIGYYTLWAHQIKTPIAAMRITLENEDSALSRSLRTELRRIERYADMVMTYLRLDAPGTDYCFREYHLDELLRPVLRQFAGEFIGKSLRLCYEPLSFSVLTDAKWLSFVIGQVLSNAVKYTQAGSVTVEMPEAGILCIRDTGIGIAPEDLPRIFENGYTGGNGRREKHASGIGLFLCRRVCRNLGHGIRAESRVGSGTAVYLDLRRERRLQE